MNKNLKTKPWFAVMTSDFFEIPSQIQISYPILEPISGDMEVFDITFTHNDFKLTISDIFECNIFHHNGSNSFSNLLELIERILLAILLEIWTDHLRMEQIYYDLHDDKSWIVLLFETFYWTSIHIQKLNQNWIKIAEIYHLSKD